VTQDIHSGPGDLAPGEQLAGYEIQQQIGRGGMAVVYRALDLRLGRLVALKVLAPHLGEDEAFRQRFMRESRAAAGVDHPHIIPVFEAGEAAGVLFIAMRYVGQGDVRSLIEAQGPLSPARTAAIVSQVASALDAAHAHGLVHRDVKPANMLLGQASGTDAEHVYLSDFGLSKHSLTPSTLTSTGQFLGTLDYVSPEQIQGQPVDGRADQYALACTVVEILTGAPPFRREDSMALMWAQLEAEPPRLTERRPELPAAVDEVIATAMSKRPSGRYASCRDFAAALTAAFAQEASARPPTAQAARVPADSVLANPVRADPAPAELAADLPAADVAEPVRQAPARPAPVGATSADPMPAVASPADPWPAHAPPMDPVPAEVTPADRLAMEPLAADPFQAEAFRDSFPPERVAADLGPSAQDSWIAPSDWFRGSGPASAEAIPAAEQTMGPGWRESAGVRSDGPVPAGISPFRYTGRDGPPHVADPRPPTRRDDVMPSTRSTKPGHSPAVGGQRRSHRARNVTLGLLITAVGLCGVAGIAYKLSHRHDTTLPPVTVTKTVPPSNGPGTGSQSPAVTVREYFAAINHHRYLLAWRLTNEHETFATFKAGYAGTQHDALTIDQINGNVVSASLVAAQTDGTVKTFHGTYTVTNGVISATDVQPGPWPSATP
jgi:Protein kinase domain